MRKTIGLIIMLFLLTGCGKTYELLSIEYIHVNPSLSEGKNLVFNTKLLRPTKELTPFKITSYYEGKKVSEYNNTPGQEFDQEIYFIKEGDDLLIVQGYNLYWEIYPAEITHRSDNLGFPEHLKKKFYEDTVFSVKGKIKLLPACICVYKEKQKIYFELDEFPDWMEQNHQGDLHWGYDDVIVKSPGLVKACEQMKTRYEATCEDPYVIPVLDFDDASIISSTDSWNLEIINKYQGENRRYTKVR